MATSKRPNVIEEDSASDDDISVTSTAPSDQRSEYGVEAIIAEDYNPREERMEYLVKWEGYPLHRSNWEPEESFIDRLPLEDFLRNKDAHKRIFEKYLQVSEEHANAREDRHHRRKAKRKKLGIFVSSTDDESDEPVLKETTSTASSSMKGTAPKKPARASGNDQPESSEDDVPLARLTKHQKQPARAAPNKKGIAQKTTRQIPLPQILAEVDNASSAEIEVGSDVDSLFGGFKQQQRNVKPPTLNSNTRTQGNDAETDGRAEHTQVSGVPVTITAHETAVSAPGSSKVPTSRRAPAPRAKKSTGSEIFAHWTSPTKRAERRRKQQPDPDAIGTVDPKTGVRLPAKTPSAYSRRSPPPPYVEAAPSPPSAPNDVSQAPTPSGWTDTQTSHWRQQSQRGYTTAEYWSPHFERPAFSTTASGRPKRQKTCSFWARGSCIHSEDRCEFLHRVTDEIAFPPRNRLPTSEMRAADGSEMPPLPAVVQRMPETLAKPAPPPPPPPLAPALPKPDLARAPSINLSTATSARSSDALLKQNAPLARLFDGPNGKVLEQRVCTWCHPKDEQQLRPFLKRLVDYGCKLYWGTDPKAWVHFLETYAKSGILIFHPGYTDFHDIFGFKKILDGPANIWSLNVDILHGSPYKLEDESSVRRLFPHGGLIFITDDIFEHYPDKASAIIEQFLLETEVKPENERFYKIVTRPGFEDYIIELAQRKLDEQGENPTDGRWYALYLDVQRLCPLMDQDPYDLPTPLESSLLMSGSMTTGEFDSFVALKGQEEASLEWITNWFAGTINTFMQYEFRRFTIIHQPKTGNSAYVDTKGWAKRYAFLDVKTPDQWLDSRRKVKS